MAAFRGFVEKSTGKIISLPNPSAYWGDAIHRQYYDFIVKQGLPAPNKPGRPYWDWRSDWDDNQVAKYFDNADEAKKYSEKIKSDQVKQEENRIGINPNAVTPAEKIENYQIAKQAYSSGVKSNNLGEQQQVIYDKYKNAAIVSNPSNFNDAVTNYSIEFSDAQLRGVENISDSQRSKLTTLANQVKDFYTKNLSPESAKLIQYLDDVQGAIDSVNNQRRLVKTQEERVKSSTGKQKEEAQARLVTEQDALQRLINEGNQQSTTVSDSLARVGLSNISAVAGTIDQRIGQVSQGLASLSSGRVFGTGDLANKLNMQVSDEQIVNDINQAQRKTYKELFDLGNQAIVDLQSRISKTQEMAASLSGQQRKLADEQISGLNKELAQLTSDTQQAGDLYKNFQGISGQNAANAISSFRESLRLPEERTIDQIEQIDPTIGATVRALSNQYQTMATAPIGQTQSAETEAFRAELEKGYRNYLESPIGATTTPETEALRKRIEDEAMSQLSLGAQLGAEEQRQYQQAARAAQTARGNIFGVAPAVEEAVTTGAAGEQRKLARYGAASQFLSSGQTTGDALARDVQLRNALQQSKLGAAQGFLASGQSMTDAAARDVGLRNALTQSRLGAAQNFIASGPTMYNLASQRFGTQQGLLNNYLAASAPQTTGGFQATPSAANPYAYVNPNAGFVGAQNAASIYNTLADYASQTYGAQVGAISRQPSGFQNFATLAGGFKDIAGGFGALQSAGLFCWVAREVYGIDNPKWLQFREWMLTKASDNLRNFYIEYGERIAESIRNKPRIKAIIRKWMDGKIG